ncbi:MAG TPA: ABC transporter substrate-binding protein [Sphaerochaeta sp.]|nr:ABC transporter substrate-binding protein [Sphaerochaeta sp.]
MRNISKNLFLTTAIILLITAALSPIFAQGKKEVAEESVRIVSLSPNVTETIFALGKGELLVGRSDYCNYPEEALGLPAVGTLYAPSLEQLLALEPTMAISSAFVDTQFLEAVEAAGILVVELTTQESFSGTYELIRQIAEAVDAQKEAELLLLEMQNTVKRIAIGVQNLRHPTVYMALDFGSFDSAATGDTFLSEMIQLAGGVNVADDGQYWTYSKEQLVGHDPEIILLSPRWGDSDGEATIVEFTTTAPYRDLRGVVKIFDADVISRQGPRSAYALELLAELIHGELE